MCANRNKAWLITSFNVKKIYNIKLTIQKKIETLKT